MRIATLTFLIFGGASLARADDAFTQQPVVAPTIERGEAPKPPAINVANADREKQFADGPVPLWIWGATPDKNYVLRTEFTATGVKTARLKVSADNHVVLYLNGKQVAASDEWQEAAEADVTKLLKDKNELVAECRNDDGPAGLVLKLVLVPEKGQTKYVVSDEIWLAAEKKGGAEVKAKKIATYGDQPWGRVFEGSAAVESGSKVPANTFVALARIPSGEALYGAEVRTRLVGEPHRRRQGALDRQRPGGQGARAHHAGSGGHR